MRHIRISLFVSAFLALLTIQPSHAGIRVVSDIDDTVKISNVGDPLGMIANGLFSNRAFTGMRELYQTLGIERRYSFSYVTGTPDVLRFRVEKFLSVNGFPKGDLYLKPTLGKESLAAYKARTIRQIIETNPKDQFIFIGDDTQVDFEVYDEIFRAVPDRIFAIYIRKVTNHKLPPSAYPFLTAFDIARTEFMMERLAVEQAAPVALALLGERKLNRIIPRFSYCPVTAAFASDPRIENWNQTIDARIQKICRERNLPRE